MCFRDLSESPERELVPGFFARFVHGERATLAFWRVAQGAVLPAHAHPHEQLSTVIEGRFELTVDGHAEVLEAGRVAVIPPNVRHEGRALTPCRIVDAFSPVREDYR